MDFRVKSVKRYGDVVKFEFLEALGVFGAVSPQPRPKSLKSHNGVAILVTRRCVCVCVSVWFLKEKKAALCGWVG